MPMTSNVSYIETLERYQDSSIQIKLLLTSILENVTDPTLLEDHICQQRKIGSIAKIYPFIEMLYVLSPKGEQLHDNAIVKKQNRDSGYEAQGAGIDRKNRPYFQMAKSSESVAVTEPYLSSIGNSLVISAARKIEDKDGSVLGYVVCDFNFLRLVSAMIGDTKRKKFIPFFNAVYSMIVIGLMLVMAMLLFTGFREITHFFQDVENSLLRPFTAIIFLTLSLSIFDLAKTILEEEVLMQKDIFRHSSTRRTITRFISAILISVSIEALLLMFKSTLNDGEHLVEAVWMMLGAVGLLIGLGIYVYLGAKAEQVFIETKRKSQLKA
jgi:hypothetical protein